MHRLQSSQGRQQKHTLYLVRYVPEQKLHETGIHRGDHRSPSLCCSTKGEIPRIPRSPSPRTALCAEGREHFDRLRTLALWTGGWHDQLRSQGQTLERRPTFFTGIFKNRHTLFLSGILSLSTMSLLVYTQVERITRVNLESAMQR